MGAIATVRKLLNVVGILGVVVAAGALVYRLVGPEWSYGLRPIAVPLAVASGALVLDFLLGVFVSVRGEEGRAYLGKFRQSTMWFGIFWTGLFAVALADPDLALLETAITVLGGVELIGATGGVFLAAWLGLRKESTEALLVGVLAWGLVGVAGAQGVSESGTGVGLLLAAALGVYFGVRSRRSTTWLLRRGSREQSTPTTGSEPPTDSGVGSGSAQGSTARRPPAKDRYQYTKIDDGDASSGTGRTRGQTTRAQESGEGPGPDAERR